MIQNSLMNKENYHCQKTDNRNTKIEITIQFLKVINDPTRLQILCFLKNESPCVCDIWQFLNIPQNLTSHHLKLLKDFGLIKAKQEGRKIIYTSNTKKITKYATQLNEFLISNL